MRQLLITRTLQLIGGIALWCWVPVTVAKAQIASDGTLSTNVNTSDGLNFTIENGNRAGNNLFHSFREFSVPTGGSAFFNNAFDVQNIFSRVTGGNISNIDGLIKANGVANLFLINPNGIIFGPNASLNIGGSFLASTADSLLFDGGIEFSATNLQSFSLLTVNIPIGLRFREPQSGIAVLGNGLLDNILGFGLKVEPGKTLALVGDEVSLLGGSLIAEGGQVELGGISEAGTVGINITNNNLNLNFPEGVARADISLIGAAIDVRAGNGGSITINARNLDLSLLTLLQAGIRQGLGSIDSKAGDIVINATGAMNIAENSVITNGVEASATGNSGDINIKVGSFSATDQSSIASLSLGQGNAGNISMKTDGLILLENSRIISSAADTAIGNSGNISIEADSIALSNNTQVSTRTIGLGNAGNVSLKANNQVSITENSLIFSDVDSTAIGNGGNISIETNLLSLAGGATLSSSTAGQGNAGSIFIKAKDTVSLSDDETNIFTTVEFNAIGKGGDIRVETGSLSLTDASMLTSTFGQGNAGNVFIQARNLVSLTNTANIFSNNLRGLNPDGSVSFPIEGSVVKGGDVSIQTNSLSLTGDSGVSTNTAGFGDAGNILVQAQTSVLLNNSVISTASSDTIPTYTSNGGNITINVEFGSLSLINGGRLASSTFNQGNAGRIFIRAKDAVFIENANSFITSVAALDTVGETSNITIGEGGDIDIQTGSLSLTDGASVISSTLGQNSAGNILIESDSVTLDQRAFITSQTGNTKVPGLGGNAGELRVTTGSLRISNGSFVSASTFNDGRGGNLIVTADTVEVVGKAANGQRSGLLTSTAGRGNAGDLLQIQARNLLVQDEAQISAATRPQSTGNGGGINIVSEQLNVENGAEVTVSAAGKGAAGNLEVTADSIRLNNGTITGETAVGDRGNITLQSQDVQLRRTSSITTNAQGIATGGNITIDTGILAALENSDIRANAQEGSGGQVRINAQAIFGSVSRTREDLQTLLNTNDPNLLDPSLLPTSDITAISQQGGPQSQGSVQLITPDVDPSSGLIELPQTIVDPDALIAQNPCTLGKGSEFTVTGRGGLPPNPSEALSSRSVRVSLVEPTQPGTTGSNTAMTVRSPRPDSLPIVPAQGWILNEKGQLVFTAYDPTGTGSNRLGRNPPTCPAR